MTGLEERPISRFGTSVPVLERRVTLGEFNLWPAKNNQLCEPAERGRLLKAWEGLTWLRTEGPISRVFKATFFAKAKNWNWKRRGSRPLVRCESHTHLRSRSQCTSAP